MVHELHKSIRKIKVSVKTGKKGKEANDRCCFEVSQKVQEITHMLSLKSSKERST